MATFISSATTTGAIPAMSSNRQRCLSLTLLIVTALSIFIEMGCSTSNSMKTSVPGAQQVLYLPDGNNSTSAYVINSDGSLTAVAGSPFATGGFGVGTDSGGKFLFTDSRASLTTNTVASSGALTMATSVNDSTLGGVISINPAGNFLYASSSDAAQGNSGWKIYSMQPDGTAQFVSGEIDQVSGPLVFTLDGSSAYSATCYHLAANIEHFAVASNGALNFTGEQVTVLSLTNPSICPNAVAIDPAGDTIASAWSDDSSGPVDNMIALYSIDPNTHALTLTSASPFPASGFGQDLRYDASGKFIVVAQDDGIGVYQVGQNSVTEISGSPFASGTNFNRVLFSPSGAFVVAISQVSQKVFVFSFNSSTGTLTAAPGSPLSAPTGYHLAILQH